MSKDCPLCGQPMRLRERERVEWLASAGQLVRRQTAEWTCPECDYFEDVDSEES